MNSPLRAGREFSIPTHNDTIRLSTRRNDDCGIALSRADVTGPTVRRDWQTLSYNYENTTAPQDHAVVRQARGRRRRVASRADAAEPVIRQEKVYAIDPRSETRKCERIMARNVGF